MLVSHRTGRRARPTRLAVASAAGALVATAILAVTAPPAAATPWSGMLNVAGGFNNIGPGCTAAVSQVTKRTGPMAANVVEPVAATSVGTGAGPTPGDTATMRGTVTGSASLTEGASGLTGIDVSASMAASVDRALGAASGCQALADAGFAIVGSFSTTTSGLLDLDMFTVGSGYLKEQVSLTRTAPTPGGAISTDTVSEFGRTHRLVRVQPGDYALFIQVTASASTDPASFGQAVPSSQADFRLHAAFLPYGSADGPADGTGKKYISLGDAVSCSSHSVTADFTARAGRKVKHGRSPVIRRARFYVDGASVRTVRRPNRSTSVAVPVPDATSTVSVALVLGARGRGSVTVERTYLPCS